MSMRGLIGATLATALVAAPLKAQEVDISDVVNALRTSENCDLAPTPNLMACRAVYEGREVAGVRYTTIQVAHVRVSGNEIFSVTYTNAQRGVGATSVQYRDITGVEAGPNSTLNLVPGADGIPDSIDLWYLTYEQALIVAQDPSLLDEFTQHPDVQLGHVRHYQAALGLVLREHDGN